MANVTWGLKGIGLRSRRLRQPLLQLVNEVLGRGGVLGFDRFKLSQELFRSLFMAR